MVKNRDVVIVDEITPHLQRMKEQLPRKLKEAVKESTSQTQRIAKYETPRSRMSFEQRMARVKDVKRQPYYTRAISEVIERKHTWRQLDFNGRVYYSKMNGWRAHFPNYGTKYQASQSFIEKTRERSARQDYKIKSKAIRSWLNGK